MAITIRDATGTMRAVPVPRMRDATSVVRVIREGWIRDEANVPRQFLKPMTGSVYPDTLANTQGVFDFPYVVYASSGSIIIDGGLAPITFFWEFVSGSTAVLCENWTAQTTRFLSHFTGPATRTAVWRGTATDAAGQTVTDTISVSLTALDWD